MTTAIKKLYRQQEPRELPNYAIPEAARYLRLPPSTLRAWTLGMGDSFRPVIAVAQKSPPALSFFNLVEAHVLSAIRESVPLPKIRLALRYVERNLGISRPLVNKAFQTDGVNLFVEHFGKLLNVSQQGQVAMHDVLREYLERIDFDPQQLAVRLYPFTREPTSPAVLDPHDPKAVVFDPAISFGRLVIAGTGIATAAVNGRFLAGDTIQELARDFDVDARAVEEAIRCESLQKAA